MLTVDRLAELLHELRIGDQSWMDQHTWKAHVEEAHVLRHAIMRELGLSKYPGAHEDCVQIVLTEVGRHIGVGVDSRHAAHATTPEAHGPTQASDPD